MPDYDYFERLERERLMRESSSSQETNSYFEDDEEYEEDETEFMTEEQMRQAAIKNVESYTGINTNNLNNKTNTNANESEVGNMPNLENEESKTSEAVVSFDLDSLNDPNSTIGKVMNMIQDDQQLLQVDAAREQIPEEGPSQEQTQDQTQEKSAEVSALEENEMTESLKYIRENMMKNRPFTKQLDKNLYINKKEIIDINNKYFNDVAEFQAKGMNEIKAKAEAKKIKEASLDNLCKNAKHFDEKSFKEMQLMAGKQSKSFDVIHFSMDKDGKPQLSNVRISGHSMTAKQLKNMNDAKQKSQSHDRGVEKNMGGIAHNTRSFIGGDAQSQFISTIMITADVLLAAIHEMMKKTNDARIALIENAIKKQIELGENNIDFDEIEAQVNEEFKEAQNQIKEEQSSEKSEDLKGEEPLKEQNTDEIELADTNEKTPNEPNKETVNDVLNDNVNENGEKVSDEASADTDLEPGESKEEEAREDESVDDIYLDEERVDSSNNNQTFVEDVLDKDNDNDIDLEDMLR